MTSSLTFLLAPAPALPAGEPSLAELQRAQRLGPAGGFRLRIFSLGRRAPAELADLPLDGQLSGGARRTSDGTQLLCDAIVPHIECRRDWLGVYRPAPADPQRLQCLDRFPLSEASNETCWFYPTHDGTYLSWERGLGLGLGPGTLAATPPVRDDNPYGRERVAVLWSLLGDDASLTCVGLTYGGQRIDWPLQAVEPEAMATWSRFRVDSQAEVTLAVEESRTVFAPPPPQA